MSTAHRGELGGWQSRTTFVLAPSASAVGLGNIWRFSYLAGENGGGPFVLAYLLCLVLVAVPVMIAEVVIGTHGRGSPPMAIRWTADRSMLSRGWMLLGVLACFTGLLVLCYYVVVAGWAVDYAWLMQAGEFGSASAADGKLNFLFILADDLGYMDVGFNNADTFYETPNLDTLASGGMVFTDFYAACQVCSPTRASILTGKYPHSNGLVHLHQPLSRKETTLGLLLREGGYHTEAVGKWGLGGEVKGQFSSNIEEKTGSSTERWIERLQQRPKDKPFFFWLASKISNALSNSSIASSVLSR